MPLILAVVFVIVGTVAYMALRNAQDFSDANEIIPGIPTTAPKEWAGGHSPEARLHRRLRDAVGALRENSAMDRPSLADVRLSLEQQALAVDDRLIATAALAKGRVSKGRVSKGRREEPLAEIAEAVDSIEAVVASLVELRGPEMEATEERIEDLRARVALIAPAGPPRRRRRRRGPGDVLTGLHQLPQGRGYRRDMTGSHLRRSPRRVDRAVVIVVVISLVVGFVIGLAITWLTG